MRWGGRSARIDPPSPQAYDSPPAYPPGAKDMRRSRAILLWTLVFAVIGGGVAVFFWAVRQTPEFYEAAIEEEPAPEVRRDDAKQFVQRTLNLVDGIQNANKWAEQFTQTQINSWLAEELQ